MNPPGVYELYHHIAAKNSAGLKLDDAQQLCLHIFCTLDGLPMEYRRGRYGRVELGDIFSRLARSGILVRSVQSAKNRNSVGPEDAKYWNDLIDDLIFRRVARDEDFKSRLGLYI